MFEKIFSIEVQKDASPQDLFWWNIIHLFCPWGSSLYNLGSLFCPYVRNEFPLCILVTFRLVFWSKNVTRFSPEEILSKCIFVHYCTMLSETEGPGAGPPRFCILSVNPIPTRRTDYFQHITTCPLPFRIFRPSYGPALQIIDGWPPKETSLSHWMIHVPIRLLSLISLGLVCRAACHIE